MDTPQAPDNSALDTNSAAAAFSALLEPPQAEEKQEGPSEASEVEAKAEPEAEAETVDPADQPTEAEEDGTITLEVDGKPVTLTKEQLAEAYKGQLRQSDYTKKTMEVAEQRKAVETEVAKARAEREQYANGLQQANAVLVAQLQERTVDQWNELAQTDPAKWVLERNLYEQRHAAYQQNLTKLGQLQERAQAEAKEAHQSYLSQQREHLLAKLPDWKDESKAKAEKSAITSFLKEQGYDDSEIGGLTDHRAVLLARDAMRYRDLVAKAKVATTKVQAAPQKVVKPGVGDRPAIDGRTKAMRDLSKSGSIEDGARAFASFL